MNTQAPLFAEQNLNSEIEKQTAELYCRLYALAAEDFTSVKDVDTYLKLLLEWQRAVQTSLTNLMSIIANHTHFIPPHTHPETPHTHICANPGSPSSPQVGSYMTGPTPLTTNIPNESATIIWTEIPGPQYVNTTLATPNMTGNMIMTGPSLTGPMIVAPRRTLVPKALLKPTILPLAKGLV